MNFDRKSHRIPEEEKLQIRAQKERERNKKRWERMQTSDWKAGFHRDEIDAQILEKKQRLEQEKMQDLKYDEELCGTASNMLDKEKMDALEKRKENIDYAKKLQKFDIKSTDTFDLNNPNILRDNKPPRVNDGNIPISSLQKFDGEDLFYKERTKVQKDQSRALFTEQMQEKKSVLEQQYVEDRVYAKQIEQRTQFLTEKDQQKAQLRIQKNKVIQKENIEISYAHKEMLKQEQMEDKLTNANEIEYQKNSFFLTEDEKATRRVGNPDRYITYNFKGFEPEVTKKFHEQRIQQACDVEQNKKNRKLEEYQWAEKMEIQRKHALKMEMRKRRNKTQQITSYREQLEEQMELQKEAERKRNNLYKNEISPSFFDQFGTSYR